MRCVLYQARRSEFGCKRLDCDCELHLRVEGYEEPDARLVARGHFLFRLEALQAVGCVFHQNDLDRDTWDELIALKRARHWIDEQVEEQRERIRTAKELIKKAATVAAQESGLPPPGRSLFSK